MSAEIGLVLGVALFLAAYFGLMALMWFFLFKPWVDDLERRRRAIAERQRRLDERRNVS